VINLDIHVLADLVRVHLLSTQFILFILRYELILFFNNILIYKWKIIPKTILFVLKRDDYWRIFQFFI